MNPIQQSSSHLYDNLRRAEGLFNQARPYFGRTTMTLNLIEFHRTYVAPWPQNPHYQALKSSSTQNPLRLFIYHPQQQQPADQVMSDHHNTAFMQTATSQPMNSYNQNPQPLSFIPSTLYSPDAVPTFSQRKAQIPTFVPAPFPGVRPPAHQRLAPLALRSGFLEDLERVHLPTSHEMATNIPSQPNFQQAPIPVSNPANPTNPTKWYNQLGSQAAPGSLLSMHTPLPYGPGSRIMYPLINRTTSRELQHMIYQGLPSVAKVTNRGLAPFAENAKEFKSAEWGVLKICNIPYSTTRDEVKNFLGHSPKLLIKNIGNGIHIIMDRVSGKTMDCFVEFLSSTDAQIAADKLNSRCRLLKLGTPPMHRVVTVQVSSQEELMKHLFPRAKNVNWPNGKPVIYQSDEPYNTGFKAFISGEELTMMCKHAEQPHRSNYTAKCPQRTYECMISILTKFPWSSVDQYTIATRDQIFKATRDQLCHMMTALRRGGQMKLSTDLLWELMIAGLNAPGFSERQRWELIQAAEYQGPHIGLSPLAEWWPWEVLGRKAYVPEDLVEFYAHLITLHPNTVNTPSLTVPGTHTPFGKLALTKIPELTMAAAAEREWNHLWTILEEVMESYAQVRVNG